MTVLTFRYAVEQRRQFPGVVAAPLRAGIAAESDETSSHDEEQNVLTPS
jgi:hypothetical protein